MTRLFVVGALAVIGMLGMESQAQAQVRIQIGGRNGGIVIGSYPGGRSFEYFGNNGTYFGSRTYNPALGYGGYGYGGYTQPHYHVLPHGNHLHAVPHYGPDYYYYGQRYYRLPNGVLVPGR